MYKTILILILGSWLILGAFLEVTPVQARRGADDYLETLDDRGRGKGRGRDDFLEGRHRGRSRGRHHLQGEDHRRGRGSGGDGNRMLQDDSTGRDRGRGRGWDDR